MANILAAQDEPMRGCFPDVPSPGHSDSLPPESARCWEAPDKKCNAVPAGEKDKPWEYVIPTGDPIWGRFKLEPQGWGSADTYQKRLYFKREDGMCIIEMQAKADLNQDGIHATYTKAWSFPIEQRPVRVDLLGRTSFYERPGAQDYPPNPPVFSNDWLGR